MLERGPAAGDAQAEEQRVKPARHGDREIADSAREQPEGEQAALAEALRDYPGGQLEDPHRRAVGGANHADLRVAEPEGLGEHRQQDIDGGGQAILHDVRAAARGQRPPLPPFQGHVSGKLIASERAPGSRPSPSG